MTFWTPVSIAFLISLRAPSVGVVSDYLIGSDVDWHTASIDLEFERQDNRQYFNYELGAGTETLKGSNWEWTIETRSSQARDISRQKVVFRRRFWFLGVGVAGVADSYDFKRLKGVMDYRLPFKWGDKYDYGYVQYLTNYNDITIWDVYIEIEEKEARAVKPFLSIRYYNVSTGKDDWQIRIGFKITYEEIE